MDTFKPTRYFIPDGIPQEEKVESMLRQVGLEGALLSLPQTGQVVREQSGTGFDFLELLLEKEIAAREERRVRRWTREAQFRKVHTLHEFDFSYQPGIDRMQIKEFASCRFVKEGGHIVFLGPNGVGKTHLSVALGVEAIGKGYKALFMPLDRLLSLVDKADEKTLPKLLRSLILPRLLILDDMDYYSTDGKASLFLFQLLYQRGEDKLSTILTSNKQISDWAGLFGTRERALGAFDRIVGDAEIVRIDGDSYRMRGKLKGSPGLASNF